MRATWATGPARLLRLVSVDLGREEIAHYWWDTDTVPWTVYGKEIWTGHDGWCLAVEWAASHGYTISAD